MKNSLLKLIAAMLCLCLVISAFTGCGGDAPKEKEPESSVAAEEKPDEETSEEDISEESVPEELTINAEDYYGVWEYTGSNDWVVIYGDGTLYHYDEEGEENGPYNYSMEEGVLYIAELEGGFILGTDGIMMDSEGLELIPSELPDFTPAPYYEENGLVIDHELNDDYIVLDDGGYYYENDSGKNYTLAPIAWQISSEEAVDTGDGYKLITVTGACGFAEEDYDGKHTMGWLYMFSDYYTGYVLPDNEIFTDGDGNYRFDFDCNGVPVDISISETKEWLKDEPGYTNVCLATWNIRMPVDYDGLVISVHVQQEDYESKQDFRAFASEADSYAPILDWPDLSPYESVYTRIY